MKSGMSEVQATKRKSSKQSWWHKLSQWLVSSLACEYRHQDMEPQAPYKIEPAAREELYPHPKLHTTERFYFDAFVIYATTKENYVAFSVYSKYSQLESPYGNLGNLVLEGSIGPGDSSTLRYTKELIYQKELFETLYAYAEKHLK